MQNDNSNSIGIKRSMMIFPILLALYEVVTYLSNDAYLPGLPQIARDLHTTLHLAQLTVTVIFMGSASMQMILGPIADRVGRRPVLLVGGLVFILSTLGCSFTNNIYHLLIFRFIQGTTVTALVIAGYSTIHDLYNQKQAIHILAIMGSITLLAPAFGPLIGSMIMYFSNWRWVFGCLAIAGIFVITGLFFKMPETVKENTEKPGLKRIITQYKNIFMNKSFILFSLLPLFLFSALIAWIVSGPFLLIDVFHFQPHDFGIAQAFIFGGLILGLRMVKTMMEKYPLKKIILIGSMTSLFGGMYGFLTSILFPNVVWNIIIAMMLISVGAGLVFPIANRLSVESSTEPMGSRVAVSSFLTSIFGMIGSGIISGFYNGKLVSLGIIIIVFCSIAFLIQFVLIRHMKNDRAS